MPKRANVHYKKAHRCHYINIRGKAHRLDPDYDKSVELANELLHDTGDDPLVTDVLQRFLERRHAKSAEGTKGFHRRAIDSFSSWLKGKRLTIDRLKPAHVNEWLDERHAFKRKQVKQGEWIVTDEPTSDTYKANLIRPIKEAMRWWAVENELSRVPLSGLAKPAQAAREDVLTEEQYAIVLSAASPSIRDVVVCLWESGCRPKELRDVEARHYVPGENPCWYFPPDEAKCGKKTKRPRIVPLNKATVGITERLIKEHPDGGKLFRNSHGNPWSKDAIGRRLQDLEDKVQTLLLKTVKAKKGQKKPERVKVTPYVFRHSFATRMANSGKIDSLHLSAAMGHSDSRMLERVYAKIRNERSIGEAMRRVWVDDAA
jgi:integrase